MAEEEKPAAYIIICIADGNAMRYKYVADMGNWRKAVKLIEASGLIICYVRHSDGTILLGSI